MSMSASLTANQQKQFDFTKYRCLFTSEINSIAICQGTQYAEDESQYGTSLNLNYMKSDILNEDISITKIGLILNGSPYVYSYGILIIMTGDGEEFTCTRNSDASWQLPEELTEKLNVGMGDYSQVLFGPSVTDPYNIVKVSLVYNNTEAFPGNYMEIFFNKLD